MNKLDTKMKVIIGLALTALVFSVGYFSKGASTVTEIKEVIKTVTVKEEAKTKIVYKDRIVYPDGTIKESERSEENTNTKEGTSTEASRTANTETKRDVGLTLSALAMVNASDFQGHKDYGVHVTKRVLGNINVGVLATTDKKIGLSLGLSF